MSNTRPESMLGELIPELREWEGGKGIDALTWISCVGSYEHAIGYVQLFWPEFVEHDGCILRAPLDVKAYRSCLERQGGDRRVAEERMNILCLACFFGSVNREPSIAQVNYLARVVREMWRAKLQLDYPNRKMEVILSASTTELHSNFVTFFQDRLPKAAGKAQGGK